MSKGVRYEGDASGGLEGRRRHASFFTLTPVVELDATSHERLLRRCALYVIVAAVLFAGLYGLLSWCKYRAYMDARFDLGNMIQAVYNTSQGRLLEITTGEEIPRQMSRLGSHVDPILVPFALAWLVWPSPTMLLVLQAAIVATGAWPAYRLGARVTRDPRAGALLAGAYLLYPATGFLVLNEFHPVALATPLLLWAFWYMEAARWLPAAVFLLMAAACKETVPLAIALMGVYFALRKRSWLPLVVTAFAILYFAAAVWIVIPHFNESQSAFIGRYGEYGESAGQVVRTMVTDPVKTLGDVVAKANISYLMRLVWPLAFAPLFSPLTALMAAPELMLNALSSTPFQRRIEFHYTALAIPFLFAAAVFGVMRVWRWLGGGFRRGESEMAGERPSRLALAATVLLAAFAGSYFLGPIPLPGATYTAAYYSRDAHDAVLDRAVALIPDNVPVSVNNNAGAQLAARRVAYVFPSYEGAEWVLVDERHPFVFDKENRLLHAQAVRALEGDARFDRVFWEDGVAVFKRVTPVSE